MFINKEYNWCVIKCLVSETVVVPVSNCIESSTKGLHGCTIMTWRRSISTETGSMKQVGFGW